MQGEWHLAAHWICALVMVALAFSTLRLRTQLRRQTAERARERRMREELESYAQVDTSLTGAGRGGADRVEVARELGKRVCRAIAEKSAFTRVGLLLRDAEERLYCAGSVGVDDLTVKALDAWGRRIVDEERGVVTGVSPAGPSALRPGTGSFSIALGEWSRFDPEIAEWAQAGKRERRRWRRALVAPVRTSGGYLAGAVVVCADGPRGRERKAFHDGLERAMGPIEALAARLAGSLENETLGERLRRAEKLAGLGQLAGGVARAFGAPLTAVLGFAELIAETAGETRVRQDAETIRAEAVKMRATVERLREFWRPALVAGEGLDLGEVIQTLAAECRERLCRCGVSLEVHVPDHVPAVCGSRERLRHLLEHLLDNAAQSIAAEKTRHGSHNPHEEPGEPHSIRISLTVSTLGDGRSLHLIVSDTGTGFDEPGRAFDPFYTTHGPAAGAGLGLSICFAIVREHGGEISAFNLHPRGAALVVELPVIRAATATEMRQAEPDRMGLAS